MWLTVSTSEEQLICAVEVTLGNLPNHTRLTVSISVNMIRSGLSILTCVLVKEVRPRALLGLNPDDCEHIFSIYDRIECNSFRERL